MPNNHLLLPTGGGGLELWVDYSCYCRHQTLCLHAFGALGVTSIHSYFISQTTKGCYCQQIGEGGISPGAMLYMQLK